ncbi:hypothetical protein SBRCBS47491_005387 [Sporothrix bragantina]|uniref:Fe2OG dioxygenase domain-containing protein n=1 Tax=Sporothrix bragantina TaxID=671064 RepID=A0ABP0BX65_9PEZI
MATETATITVPGIVPEPQYVVFHGLKGEGRRPTFESIPQIDFTDMNGSLEARQALAAQVKAAFTESGFLYSCNYGISVELQAEVLDIMKTFFTLPTEEKVKIHINHSPEIKGYECLFETKLDTHRRGDLKEALNFGDDPTEPEQNCPPGFDLSYYPGNGTVPINQWSVKPVSFRRVLYDYHAAVMAFSRQLLHIIALALDLNDFSHGRIAAALLPAQELAKDIDIGAHADYSWFTVVNQLTDAPALEVLNSNGHWVSAPPLLNTLVVNVGDFLERATNTVFVSTVHRVVNKTAGVARYACPFSSVQATMP